MDKHDRKWTRRTAIKAACALASAPALGWVPSSDTKGVTPTPISLGKSPPDPNDWQALKESLTGDLLEVQSPLEICKADPSSTAAKAVMKNMKNPFFLEEQPGATHTGFIDNTS